MDCTPRWQFCPSHCPPRCSLQGGAHYLETNRHRFLSEQLARGGITVRILRQTFGTSGHPKRCYGSDQTERVGWENGVNLSSVGIWSEYFQRLAASHDHLLLFGARKVAMNGLRDARGFLQRQRVEMHRFPPASSMTPCKVYCTIFHHMDGK